VSKEPRLISFEDLDLDKDSQEVVQLLQAALKAMLLRSGSHSQVFSYDEMIAACGDNRDIVVFKRPDGGLDVKFELQ
jgi:hypothetical protein